MLKDHRSCCFDCRRQPLGRLVVAQQAPGHHVQDGDLLVALQVVEDHDAGRFVRNTHGIDDHPQCLNE